MEKVIYWISGFIILFLISSGCQYMNFTWALCHDGTGRNNLTVNNIDINCGEKVDTSLKDTKCGPGNGTVYFSGHSIHPYDGNQYDYVICCKSYLGYLFDSQGSCLFKEFYP